jgi:hypothetical protein
MTTSTAKTFTSKLSLTIIDYNEMSDIFTLKTQLSIENHSSYINMSGTQLNVLLEENINITPTQKAFTAINDLITSETDIPTDLIGMTATVDFALLERRANS